MKKDIKSCDNCANDYVVATNSKDEILYCPFCGEEDTTPVEIDEDEE